MLPSLNNQPCHGSTRAFTLVELLTVLAVVAILAALGFPALGSFMKRADETKCVSNLRQMGAAIASYAAENNNELPINNSPTKGIRWYIMLNPYLGKSTSADAEGWRAPSIFICPANDPKTPGSGKYKIWDDYGYACNLALMPRISGETYFPGQPVRLSSIKGRRVLVADTGTNRSQYLMSASTQLPYGGQPLRGHIHRGGLNMLWSDFSVSWEKAEEFISADGAKVSWY